jgi:hypothetical protein
MQNDADAQETEANCTSGVISMAADQEVPFQAKALPEVRSTAMQNDADGQETEVKSLTLSMWLGVDHVRREPAASAERLDLFGDRVRGTACMCVTEVLAATLVSCI